MIAREDGIDPSAGAVPPTVAGGVPVPVPDTEGGHCRIQLVLDPFAAYAAHAASRDGLSFVRGFTSACDSETVETALL